MIIRQAKLEDMFKVLELADKHSISLPNDGLKLVCENDSGVIKSFVNLRNIISIEPFISEHPVYSNALWGYIEASAIQGNIKIMRCFANKKHVELYKKLGFYEPFPEHTSLEINFFERR